MRLGDTSATHAEHLDIEFQVADAELLPLDDGLFDVALSTFGAMFTPEHATVAARVNARSPQRWLHPHGDPNAGGLSGQLFGVIGAHVPPPGVLQSPALWGSERRIVELFGPQAKNIRCERCPCNFRYQSAGHWIKVLRSFHAPTPVATRTG